MPPKAKRRRSLRCAYREGNRRCPKDGEGNPPICRAHRVALNAEAERQATPGGGLADLLDRFFNGKPISTDNLKKAAADLGGIFTGSRGAPQPQAGQPWWDPVRQGGRVDRPPPQQAPRVGQPPPPRPPPRAAPDAIMRARKTLGFKPNEKVTAELLRARHRKLAMRHHPDRGGSVTKMAGLNHARDILAANLV